MEDETEVSLLDKVIKLQDGLVSSGTGGAFEGGDQVYTRLRSELLASPEAKSRLPDFVRRNRDLAQFWQFIKYAHSTYADRRRFIWDAFHPLIENLEAQSANPGADTITISLAAFDAESVHTAWQKALDRRATDPEGAITAARSLLETACKHILDDANQVYPDDADLPKLWALAAEVTNLAPSQHQETVFKAILGNCQSVVNNIGAIRNKIGDAHGQGRKPVRPKPRHAELVVNLAGAMVSFLVSTWNERKENASAK